MSISLKIEEAFVIDYRSSAKVAKETKVSDLARYIEHSVYMSLD